MGSETTSTIYTKQFFLLCLAMVFLLASVQSIIPELPGYMRRELDGADYLKWFIPLFTLGALLSRPFSGKITDEVGRIPPMFFGALICMLMGVLYNVVGGIVGFLILRFFHGLATGFGPPAIMTLLGDIVPEDRKGEALGFMGMAGSTGMALGPLMGSYLAQNFSYDVMFYTSGLIALVSFSFMTRVKETVSSKQQLSGRHFKVSWRDFYDPKVVWPSLIMFLVIFPFGFILTVIGDFSRHLGLENKGVYFGVYLTVSILVRFVSGKASDRYGRLKVLLVGVLFLVCAMYTAAWSTNIQMFILSAVFYGLSVGMNAPTLFAWTMDLADIKRRGQAMGMLYVALEVGIMFGGFYGGWIYNNDTTMFFPTFFYGAILPVIGLVLLWWKVQKARKSGI